MPNSKCIKCNLYLDTIIKNKQHKINFATLIHKRIKKCFGIPYFIDPCITHNEINDEQECDGELNYEQFTKNPINFNELNFNNIFFNFNVETIIKKINNN
jgi:hypothetical protein